MVKVIQYGKGRVYPSIPDPQPTLSALYHCAHALKECVEILTGQRGPQTNKLTSVVTFGDLIQLGIIEPEQVKTMAEVRDVRTYR